MWFIARKVVETFARTSTFFIGLFARIRSDAYFRFVLDIRSDDSLLVHVFMHCGEQNVLPDRR
jgi:hypothetical protein